jgi:hypothetical protein
MQHPNRPAADPPAARLAAIREALDRADGALSEARAEADALFYLRRARSCRTGSARRSSVHPQVLGDTGDPPLEEADRRRRGPKFRVRDQLGLDELNDPTAAFERAGPAGEDVLHPLHLSPVGQEEEVGIASSEHVDRRVIGPSGLSASEH